MVMADPSDHGHGKNIYTRYKVLWGQAMWIRFLWIKVFFNLSLLRSSPLLRQELEEGLCCGLTFQSVLQQVYLKQQWKTTSEDQSVFLFFWSTSQFDLFNLDLQLYLKPKKRVSMERGLSIPTFLISAYIISLCSEMLTVTNFFCCCKISKLNIIIKVTGRKVLIYQKMKISCFALQTPF